MTGVILFSFFYDDKTNTENIEYVVLRTYIYKSKMYKCKSDKCGWNLRWKKKKLEYNLKIWIYSVIKLHILKKKKYIYIYIYI